MPITEVVADAVRSTDVVLRNLAQQITGEVAAFGDVAFSATDVNRLTRKIERHMSFVYGVNQRRANKGILYNTITRSTDRASETAFRDFFGSLRKELPNVDPDAWSQIERKLGQGGNGRADELAKAFTSLGGPHAQRQAYLRSGLLDPNRRWVKGDGYRLSDRVWQNGRRARRGIDRTIRDGVRRGDGPVTISRALNQYLNPDFAPLTFKRNGQILRKRGVYDKPSAASAARALARTEVSQMHHAATRQAIAAIDVRGAGGRWSLSPNHPKRDICDSYASNSSFNMPPGVYIVGEIPHIPHTQCLCSIAPYLPSREDVLEQLGDRYGVPVNRFGRSRPTTNPRAVERPIPSDLLERADAMDDVEYEFLQRASDQFGMRERDIAFNNVGHMDPDNFGVATNNILDAMDMRADEGWPVFNGKWEIDGDPSAGATASYIRPHGGNPDVMTFYLDDPVWYASRADQIYTEGGQFKSFVDYSPYGVINHEHGHWLHYYTGGSDRNGGFHDWDGRYYEYYDDALFDNNTELANLAGYEVSAYAQHSGHEFVAEVYTGMLDGLDYPDEVWDWYIKLWGPDPWGNGFDE